MANQTAKTLVSFFDKACKQLDEDTTMARLCNVDTVDGGTLQNSQNIYWRNVEQQAPVIDGWDLSSQETSVIEQCYPLSLGTPHNDFVQIRVDELRDTGFMERRVRASSKKLSSDQNQRIADLIASTGSLYYESSTSGFDFVADADTILTERQANRDMGASFFLAPRTSQVMASSLAGVDASLAGRNESAYATALIGKNVAGFDVYRASYAGSVSARANATTSDVDGDITEVPEGYTTSGGVVTNVDYRYGTVTLTAGTNYNVGDVITFAGVNSVGMMDKVDTGQLMTFKIIAKDTNDLTLYPKPIAADQAGITDEQAAYANISTAIVDTMVVSKVNATGGRANSFMANDSIEIVNGNAPLETLNEFDGMKVVSETLDSGVKLWMAYDARLDTLNCRVRLFTWYGLVNKDPSRNGNAIYTG